MNIFEKLNLAREKFHSLQLKKTGHNKFAGYNYFELGDFLIPALRVFKEVGLTAVVSFDKEMAQMTIIDATGPMVGAERPYIIIKSPMGSAALKGCHEVQNIGAVETYQRRYLWVAALEIVEHDALDASEPIKEKKWERGGVASQTLEVAGKAAISDERKSYIEDSARYVIEAFEGGGPQGGFERIEQEEFEDIEKIYLGTILPSNVRNPITAYSRQYHSKKVPA